MEKTPFIVVSLVGQELLSSGRLDQSLRVLEAARSIGTDSARLEASLLQTLGNAYWQSGNVSQALEYMERNLTINISNKDERGQCKSHANLGVAYGSLGQYQEASYHHEQQLRCAQLVGDYQEGLDALNQMAKCVMKLGNPAQAAIFYKDAYKMARQVADRVVLFQQLLKVADAYELANDLDNTLLWYRKHLSLAKEKRDKKQEALAYASLGQINHIRGNYEQAMMFYQQLLSVAVELNDKKMKAKAYGGMGQANESMLNYYYAQACREQQLKLSREMKDTDGEATALIQLGHISQQTQKVSQAMSYYSQSLTLSQQRKDRAAEGRVYANLGKCHMTLGNLREAVKFFKHELAIANEVDDRASEVTTLVNLGTAFLSLENYEEAHEHLTRSLQLAKERNDESLECQALSSLGNFYTKRSEHQHALPLLNKALRMAKILKDFSLESKICHNLGLCQEALGNHQQAIQFYQHDFVVAKEAKDKEGMTRACEKLINANQRIGDTVQADIYKKKLLNMAEEMEHTSNRCCLLNKMAEDLLNANDYEQAITYYQQLLSEAKREQHQSFEGLAYCGLGNAYLALDKYDNALSQYQRDLTIRKETSDTTGECKAYGNLGSVYNCTGQLQQACNCYERSLALAQQLDNPLLISNAYSCLGIVYRNMKNYEEAIRMHQKQLEMVLALKEQLVEHSKAYANLGESYEAVVNFAHAVHCHEQHLALMQKMNDPMGLLKAYGSLGRTNRGLGRLPQALNYFRRRLDLAKELEDFDVTIECYADLGGVYMLMGNYVEALSVYNKQFHLARDLENHADEAAAACGLGEVNFALNRHKEALEYYHHDWRICHEMGMLDGEARALGNIAEHFELLGDYQTAIEHREKQLEIANQIQDDILKAVSLHGLGVININLRCDSKAIKMLKQALVLISGSQETELEAKIRYYLGVAFFHTGEFEYAYVSLTRAVPLFDQLYQGTNAYFDYSTKRTLLLHSKLYQTLIHVLVKQNKVEEALSVAEKERKRAIVDIFLEKGVCRQVLQNVGLLKEQSLSPEALVEVVSSYRAPVIYYTVALGHLFTWLIVPKNGVVQFRHCDLQTLDMSGSDNSSVYSQLSNSYIPLVDRVIAVRQALGVEQMRNFSASSRSYDELEFDDTDSLDSGEYYTSGKPPSVSSVGGGYSRGLHVNLYPIHDLYDILIRPVEAALPKPLVPGSNYGRLIIIPDRDLYLVPFALLKGEGNSQFLYKRYHLCLAPSVHALMASTRHKVPLHRRASVSGTRGNTTSGSPPSDFSSKVYRSQSFTRAKHNSTPIVPSEQLNPDMYTAEPLVVGNPMAPLTSPTLVLPNPAAEREVTVVADLLNVRPLVGTAATKERFLNQLSLAESIHLAASVSWAKGEIMLAPKTGSSESLDDSGRRMANGRVSGEGATMSVRGVADGAVSNVPSPTEYVVTLEDILTAKLSAKMVVISSCYKPEQGYLRADHILAVVQAFLVGGAQCVVIPLWPNSSNSSRHLMNAFYSSLVRGSRTSRGMCYAMQVRLICLFIYVVRTSALEFEIRN